MVEELNGQIPACVDSGREAIEAYKLRIRPLQKRDFEEAFKRIRVDVEKLKKMVDRFHEFAQSN
jgi:nitrogen fixation/metabolism regulation signal transduction histidine kinase